MDSHKKILGILYLVFGSLQLLFLSVLSIFIGALFAFIAKEAGPDGEWVLRLIGTFVPIIIWCVIILIAIPSIIGGIAILNDKPWALLLLLILGCLKLLSFPIGTALGIYTIWVYAETNKEKQKSSQKA